ncbi:ABC transporter substrate-binding protein [Acidovorax soli]|jgi:branched-chain amino acid transport system substrate-binding protein|uniref:Branched-chain amino acid transport system substrate-binding protein n=1 Tax=Acidovorax soli TaxID=592050 RepID=A0A1H4FD04_9BURK|nr:ABC transporter substrate-binding protein [Acidovorax soli]SEA95213.1 branched-chain amino acid transport system substrate-binding protein [Acidovorax soli]
MNIRNQKLTRAGLVAAAIAAAFAVVPAAHAQKVVKLGVIMPMSGPNAAFGNTSLNGIKLAVEEFNAKGGVKSLGGAKIELVVADIPQPNAAAAATQRLISQERVSGVIGSFVSSVTIAASEVTERAGVPLITFAFADEITGRGYKNVFQVSPKGSVVGRAQFDYALGLSKQAGEPVKKVAILYEDTAYGTAQAKGLREGAKAAGIEVVVDEAYPLGITDATPLVNKVRASGAQMVFPVSYLNDSLLIIRTMRQQNITTPTIGGAAGYIIPDFKKGLGQYAENVLSISTASYDTAPAIGERYKAKYGAFMPHDALIFGAATEAMMQAVDQAKSDDPAKVRDALAKIKYCDGIAKGIPAGCVQFDQTGAAVGAKPVMVQWRGNDLVTVYPAELAKGKAIWGGAR